MPERRVAQLSLINEIGGKIAGVLELDSLLDRVVRLVWESFDCNHVTFWTVDREQDELVTKVRAGDFAHLFFPGYRVKLGQGIAGWVGSHGETLVANDVDAEPRYIPPPGVIGTRSELSVSVRVGGEIVGVLDVQSPHLNAFDESDVMVMETLANQIGMAMERAQLRETVQQELTERKRADQALWESEKRFRAIAETASDAFIVFDSHENIFFWNPAAKTIFGYQAGETRGKVLDSIVAGRFRDVLREEMKRVVSRERTDLIGKTVEMSGIRKDGSEFPIELSLATWGIGEEAFFTVIVRDITERKQAEEELRRTTAELEGFIRELREFARVSSHDLQEPLRMVASYVQLLAERYRGELDADADEFIGYAVDGAERMQSLLHDLLAYSRVGTHGKPFGPTDSQDAFEQTLVRLKIPIEESRAVVTADSLPVVMADAAQLSQVFQHLIDNGIKFRSEERPEIHVGAVRENGEWVFSVCDNGIGIEKHHSDRIFSIFQRLHRRREYPGTGVGLAICRRIVERHGGHIWVESEPGRGSTFGFAIPHRGEIPS